MRKEGVAASRGMRERREEEGRRSGGIGIGREEEERGTDLLDRLPLPRTSALRDGLAQEGQELGDAAVGREGEGSACEAEGRDDEMKIAVDVAAGQMTRPALS